MKPFEKPTKDKLAEHLAKEDAKRMVIMEEARKSIIKSMEKDGEFTHNIISIVLRDVANKLGYRYANDIVREFDLDDLYGIAEIEE